MRMKKGYLLYILLLIALLLTACKMQNNNDMPEVSAEFTFSELTDVDYKEVGAGDASKGDFRKVHFSVIVKYNSNWSNRKIYVPDLKEAINSYDIERYWYGQYSSKDTPEEDAEYIYDIMFLSKNLSDDDIKKIFKEAQINVTWNNKSGKEEMRRINLSDIIDFD